MKIGGFNMVTEDYVSFETAKLLKEKGFDEATHWFYKTITYLGTEANNVCIKSLNGIECEPFHNSIFGFDLNGEDTGEYAMPTIQMIMKWLRNIHGLFIHIDVIREASCWLADIQDIKGDVSVYPVENEFPNYEEACEASIVYCLENLI